MTRLEIVWEQRDGSDPTHGQVKVGTGPVVLLPNERIFHLLQEVRTGETRQQDWRQARIVELGGSALIQIGTTRYRLAQRFEAAEMSLRIAASGGPARFIHMVPARWWILTYEMNGNLDRERTHLLVETHQSPRRVTRWRWGNVGEGGAVCWGTVSLPPTATPATLDDLFLNSVFNQDLRGLEWASQHTLETSGELERFLIEGSIQHVPLPPQPVATPTATGGPHDRVELEDDGIDPDTAEPADDDNA
jgi:hypothetical protein